MAHRGVCPVVMLSRFFGICLRFGLLDVVGDGVPILKMVNSCPFVLGFTVPGVGNCLCGS